MCDVETLEIVKWSVELANEYGIGVTGIIASFISAKKELKTDEKAKVFVENEIKGMRRLM